MFDPVSAPELDAYEALTSLFVELASRLKQDGTAGTFWIAGADWSSQVAALDPLIATAWQCLELGGSDVDVHGLADWLGRLGVNPLRLGFIRIAARIAEGEAPRRIEHELFALGAYRRLPLGEPNVEIDWSIAGHVAELAEAHARHGASGEAVIAALTALADPAIDAAWAAHDDATAHGLLVGMIETALSAGAGAARLAGLCAAWLSLDEDRLASLPAVLGATILARAEGGLAIRPTAAEQLARFDAGVAAAADWFGARAALAWPVSDDLADAWAHTTRLAFPPIVARPHRSPSETALSVVLSEAARRETDRLSFPAMSADLTTQLILRDGMILRLLLTDPA